MTMCEELVDMATALAARLADARDNPLAEGLNPRISSETFTKEIIEDNQNLNSSSSYTLASQSQFSDDVDRWIRGNTSMESTGVQNSRIRLVQRSTLALIPTIGASGLWYVLAMVLPLFSINTSCTHWRCNPSAVLNTAELVLAHVAQVCGRVRARVRRVAQEQLARELFAAAMDAVLLLYAVGFLILSMYQASIIG